MAPKNVFLAFGTDILFLFLGCFILAKAMQKHGWDKRMAYFILSRRVGSGNTEQLIIIVALFCWVLSMWISNTATCAMMVPVCLGMISTLSPQFKSESEGQNFTERLLIVCAFASSIGGIATPVGTPPNLIALQFLRDKGIEISFLEWTLMAIPLSLAMLVVLIITTRLFLKGPVLSLKDVRTEFQLKLKNSGRPTTAEIQVAVVFTLMVILWIFPDILAIVIPNSTFAAKFKDLFSLSTVAILCSSLLFILPSTVAGRSETNLVWSDLQNIDWGTILLFGGGLTIGAMLDQTGMASELAAIIFGGNISLFLTGVIAIIFAILMSEFASNTASAAIIVPIVLAVIVNEPEFATIAPSIEPIKPIIMAVAFGASFGFMLPVSTPPNAIIFGTGQIRLSSLIRCGVIFDLSGLGLIILWLWLV